MTPWRILVRPHQWLSSLCLDNRKQSARLAAAFLAVYLIWGSTYLAIRIAIETMPPFVMAGTRFIIAGAILYGWTTLRGTRSPTRVHWRSALIIGGLLLVGGNGLVTWAEQEVPSSLAALIIASTPIWFVVLEALRPGGTRPTRRTMAGVFIGFVGIAVLIGPANLASGLQIRAISLVAMLLAPISWAAGSLYPRRASLPRSPIQSNGMEMLLGGALLLILATITGEWAGFDVSAISALGRSLHLPGDFWLDHCLYCLRLAAQGNHACQGVDIRLCQSNRRRLLGLGTGQRAGYTEHVGGDGHHLVCRCADQRRVFRNITRMGTTNAE